MEQLKSVRPMHAVLFAFLLAAAISALAAPPESPRGTGGPRELVFLNWSEYIDPDLVTEFEQKFGATVKQVYFETDELRTELLLETDARGYDVVLAAGAAIPSYIRRGWIARLGASDVPNATHIDRRWLDARPQLGGHAVPYLWGTLGIGYRRDLVGRDVMTWKQLFEPGESLRNRILMINDSRDAIGMALKALGRSLNSADPVELAEAERVLLAQRPFVNDYSYVALTEDSALVSGDIWMAMMYNGDALTLQEVHPHIAYVVPQEGTNLWVDYLMVMEGSKEKTLAAAFINFLNEPTNAARLATYLNFATPQTTARRFLSRDHLDNPLIYPDDATLKKSELYALNLGARSLKQRAAIFSRLVK